MLRISYAKVRALTGEEGVPEVWNENIGQTQMGLRRELPGGPVVKTSKSQCRWQKFNLVGELRSCMLHKAAKKLK